MAPTVPSGLPSVLTVGTSWDFDLSYADFPAGDGWQLTLYLRSKVSNQTLTLSWGSQVNADGDTFEVRCAPSFSTDPDPDPEPGVWEWHGLITDGTDDYAIDPRKVNVLPIPSTSGSKSQTLVELEAVREQRRKLGKFAGVVRMSINGRTVEYSWDDLRKYEATLALRLERERNPHGRVAKKARFVNA